MPVDVEVVKPVREDVERKIVLPASVEAFERTTLYSKVSGYLSQIEVDIGDKASQGQLVAKIEVPEIAAELQAAEAKLAVTQADRGRAEAELDSAQSDHELKEITYSRLRSVREAEPDVMPQQTVDEVRAEFRATSAAVKVAESELIQIESRIKQVEAEMARLQTLLGFAEIRAPFGGVVTERFVDPGALLQAATSSQTVQKIVTVASMDKVRLSVDVPESEVPHVQVGDPASVRVDALPGENFEGQVTRFAGVLDPATRTMRTEIDLANPGWRLRPGMYGRATLSLEKRSDVLTIPADALHVEGSSAFVYQVVNGRAKRAEVETEMGDGVKVEVTAGLTGNESIVVSARGPLADDVQINSVGARSE